MVPAPPPPGRALPPKTAAPGLGLGRLGLAGALVLVAVAAVVAALGAAGVLGAGVLVVAEAVLVPAAMTEAAALHGRERRGGDGRVALLDADRVGRAVGGI